MIATAEKFLKFETNDVNRKRTPAPVRRPLTFVVSVLILYELGWLGTFGATYGRLDWTLP